MISPRSADISSLFSPPFAPPRRSAIRTRGGAAAARRSIDAALTLVVEKLADDRGSEDDAGKEANRLLGVSWTGFERLSSWKSWNNRRTQTRVLPAIVTLPARTAVDHSLTLLSTANPAAEPTSNEAREVLRFFLESFTDPQLVRGSPV